jgi:Xaa-Pro aminopeptidase
VQNNNDWLGGYVKWLTDHPTVNGYPTTVIFHLDDWMTVIDMGPLGSRRRLGGDDKVYRGVVDVLSTPAFTTVSYTDSYQAALALDDLKRRNYRAVGVAGAGALPHKFIKRIESELAPTLLIDLTDAFDWIKAIKSPEEILAIRKPAAMGAVEYLYRRCVSPKRPVAHKGVDGGAIVHDQMRLLHLEIPEEMADAIVLVPKAA